MSLLTVDTAAAQAPVSKRIDANRTNAQCSTGPKTEGGKARSSRNALVTGLTGRTVLLESDDQNEYILHLSRHHAEYLPLTDQEAELVQSIADSEWRLRRIQVLEAGIYACGAEEFAEAFPQENKTVRHMLITTRTYLVYQRQLSNLSIQEGRILRQKEKWIAALEALKQSRPKPLASAADPKAKPAKTQNAAVAVAAAHVGFEFSDTTASTLAPQTPTSRDLAAGVNTAEDLQTIG